MQPFTPFQFSLRSVARDVMALALPFASFYGWLLFN